MNDFLKHSKVDISDMDSYISKTTPAPSAPQMENRVEGGGESLYNPKKGIKDVMDFLELGAGTKKFPYEKTSGIINPIIKSLSGVKGEMTGAAAGAATGLSYASKVPFPNPLIKAGAMGLGAAIGGGIGYVTDEQGQVTPKKVMNAAGRSAAGEAIGMGLPVVAGKALSKAGNVVSKKISNYVYGALDPDKAKSILELANSKGVRLLPNQVADNKAIDQLLAVIGQNPVASQRINRLNKENKTAILNELNTMLNEYGIDSVAIRSADKIDPLGDSLKGFLKESKQGRTREIQNAYKEFENYGGAFTTESAPIKKEIQELEKLSSSMPNPAGYKNAIDYISKQLDKPELTSPELNNLIKQINYNMKHLGQEDFAIKSGYQKMKSILDGHLEILSKQDGSYKKLTKAKNLYSQKRTVYDRKEIKQVLDGADTETIYNKLLTGENSITNAQVLKQELMRTKQGEKVLGTLARRQVDEALYKVRLRQNVFKGGEIDSKAFLKVMDEIDYRQLEILGGKEMTAGLHEMRELINLIAKQDNVLAGNGGGLNTMGMIKKGLTNGLASILRIKTLGEVLTNELSHNKMLEMLRMATKSTNPNKTAQTIEEITKKQKEILDVLQ